LGERFTSLARTGTEKRQLSFDRETKRYTHSYNNHGIGMLLGYRV